MYDWYTGGEPPSEEQLHAEIAYYEGKLAEFTKGKGGHSQAILSLYHAHTMHRKKLLAAIKDGRPEAWTEYQAESGALSPTGS